MGERGRNIFGNYMLGSTLGEGSFGKVKKATNIMTGEISAMKLIDKGRVSKKSMGKITREVNILRLLKHPNIVELQEVVNSGNYIGLAMEYVEGGELFDYILTHHRVKEREARKFFWQMLLGVQYCHKKNVIHRDLKPENLLLDGRRNIKIIDFGLSNILSPDEFLKSNCGSPHYTAPEVSSKQGYGPEVDVWSLGVVLFALLCGYLPFDDPNHEKIRVMMRREQYSIPHFVSEEAAHLIARMLVANARSRITINEIMRHPWVREMAARQPVENSLSSTEPPQKGRRWNRVLPLPKGLVSAVKKVIDRGHESEESIEVPATAEQPKHDEGVAQPLTPEKLPQFSPTPEIDITSTVAKDKQRARASSVVPGSFAPTSPARGTGDRRRSDSVAPQPPLAQDGFQPVPIDGSAGTSSTSIVPESPEASRRSTSIAQASPQGRRMSMVNMRAAPLKPIQEDGVVTAAETGGMLMPLTPIEGVQMTVQVAAQAPPPQRKRRMSVAAGNYANARTERDVDVVVNAVDNTEQASPEGSTAPKYKMGAGAFNRSNASNKSPSAISLEVQNLLVRNGIYHKKKTEWRFKCRITAVPRCDGDHKPCWIAQELRFELEVFKLPRLPMHVVLYTRRAGDTWAHKDFCQSFMSQLQL